MWALLSQAIARRGEGRGGEGQRGRSKGSGLGQPGLSAVLALTLTGCLMRTLFTPLPQSEPQFTDYKMGLLIFIS